MRIIKHSQLVALLDAVAGVTFAGIETVTDARCRKTGNPHGKVAKLCRGVVTIGANYTSAVIREGNRQAVDASSFASQPLKWGHWLITDKVIGYKDKLYLRCQSTPRQRKAPQMRVVGYYTASGASLTHSQVKPWLPVKREAKTQQAHGLGETVQPRTYAFDSIKRIRLNGITYTPVADSISYLELLATIAKELGRELLTPVA